MPSVLLSAGLRIKVIFVQVICIGKLMKIDDVTNTVKVLNFRCLVKKITSSWIHKFVDFVFVPKAKFVDFIFST
jgi:hypothetical protein